MSAPQTALSICLLLGSIKVLVVTYMSRPWSLHSMGTGCLQKRLRAIVFTCPTQSGGVSMLHTQSVKELTYVFPPPDVRQALTLLASCKAVKNMALRPHMGHPKEHTVVGLVAATKASPSPFLIHF